MLPWGGRGGHLSTDIILLVAYLSACSLFNFCTLAVHNLHSIVRHAISRLSCTHVILCTTDGWLVVCTLVGSHTLHTTLQPCVSTVAARFCNHPWGPPARCRFRPPQVVLSGLRL